MDKKLKFLNGKVIATVAMFFLYDHVYAWLCKNFEWAEEHINSAKIKENLTESMSKLIQKKE